MKTKQILHLLMTFGATYLLYAQTPGLNILILSILTVISFGFLNSVKLKSTPWWFAATLLLINGFSVFYLGRDYHVILFLLALLHFVAVSHSSARTFYFLIYDTMRNTIVALAMKFGNGINILFGEKNKEEVEGGNQWKWVKKSLVFIIPALLFILFLQLYRLSSSNFDKISDFISFDWISAPWIALFICFYLLFYGWIWFQPDELMMRYEHKLSRKIVLGRADKLTHFLTRELEVKIAISIVITLSLLLAFLIVSDFLLFSQSALQQNGLEFISKELHNGVYALIASIVITVVLVSFILRGNLNFYQPKLVALAVVWLALNIVVVATNFTKNWIYIDLGGLTYKRIGVFIYLSLTFIGLLYTLFKVTMREKFFYIIRTTAISFFAFLTVTFTVNWDVIITKYNLSEKFDRNMIDYEYLISLKSGNQHILVEKFIDGEIPDEYSETIFDFSIIDYERSKNWKSLVYSEYEKQKVIASYYKN